MDVRKKSDGLDRSVEGLAKTEERAAPDVPPVLLCEATTGFEPVYKALQASA